MLVALGFSVLGPLASAPHHWNIPPATANSAYCTGGLQRAIWQRFHGRQDSLAHSEPMMSINVDEVACYYLQLLELPEIEVYSKSCAGHNIG